MIIGDLMIDEYLIGDVTRISPEAPVPVIEVHGESLKFGGAANVALNILSLGCNPILVYLLRGHTQIRSQNILPCIWGRFLPC